MSPLVMLLVSYVVEATLHDRNQNLTDKNDEAKIISEQLHEVKDGHLSDADPNISKTNGLAPNNQCGGYEALSWSFHSYMFFPGNKVVKPNSYPFMVYLFNYNKTLRLSHFQCGGSIIGNHFVLTAAQCFLVGGDKKQWYVGVGGHNLTIGKPKEQEYKVDWFRIHPNFTRNFKDDIALVHTVNEISFNEYISPICLNRKSLFSYGRSVVIGWGAFDEYSPSANLLHEIKVKPIKWSECNIHNETIDHFCAGEISGKRDACLGNLGAPLFAMDDDKYVQLGIVSWSNECEIYQYPGLYTNVSNYINWIEDETSRY